MATPRIAVKVYFANGDHLFSEINATFEEAQRYYVGQTFNVGFGPNDNLQKCTKIELIRE